MSAYSLLLAIHGYWRWVVVATTLIVLARAAMGLAGGRDWTRSDERASILWVSAIDLQTLIGLVLYFGFSPFFTAVRQSFGGAMHDASTRYFGIEHEVAMVLAVALAHIARVRARRATDARRKHRIMLISTLILVALFAWAIPWPGRVVGRPLFRTSF